MDRTIASEVQTLLARSSESLLKSIDKLRGQLTDDDFHRYCVSVGTVLTDIRLELLTPYIYAEHPDLAPPPPTEKAAQDLIARLKPTFDEAAARARRDEESQ